MGPRPAANMVFIVLLAAALAGGLYLTYYMLQAVIA
jgi:hypothetical protein